MIIIIIIRVFIMIVSHESEQAADPLSGCRCLNQNELAISAGDHDDHDYPHYADHHDNFTILIIIFQSSP